MRIGFGSVLTVPAMRPMMSSAGRSCWNDAGRGTRSGRNANGSLPVPGPNGHSLLLDTAGELGLIGGREDTRLADAVRDRTTPAEARERMMTLAGELRPYPSIYWAGYVQDAMKEAAEAAITLAIVADRPLPEPAELGTEDAAYLNAMAEAASELRRQVLDRLRENDLPRAEYLLGTMDDIYSALVTVDFPDAITGGLRRTTDALRAVLERTRGDVTTTILQGRLQRALEGDGRASGTTTA